MWDFRIIHADCWLSYPVCCKVCMSSGSSGEKRAGPWRKSCKTQRPLATITVKVPGGLWLQSPKQTYSYFHWIFQLNLGVSSRKAGLLHKIQSDRSQKVVRSWRQWSNKTVPLDRQIRMGILLWRGGRCGNTDQLGLKIKPENSSQLNDTEENSLCNYFS